MTKLIDIIMPTGQQEGTQSVVARWFKQVGESVVQHEPILEISTDKVMMELPAPASGVLKEILKNENDEIQPGMLLGRMEEGAAASVAASAQPESKRACPAATSDAAAAELSPAVRKLLKEHGLEASQISGTGKGGRISHQDVMAFIEQRGASAPSRSASKLQGKMVKHDQMRRNIAQHMVHSMSIAPHVTSVFQADLSRIIDHREKHKHDFEKRGAKLTFTTYFVRATVAALQAVPEVNSRWHDDALELFEDCNIGIGTALEQGGLIVPVLQKAQDLDLFGTAQKLQDLTARARAGKLETKDVQDGTFTISNHGVSGSLVATPIIINQPQSAILGIGKLEKRAIVDDSAGSDEIRVKPMVYVTLTLDHRVLDGFKANAFLSTFVKTLEEWS
ncbi:MAG: 2-oxo acid dehydrogenase subunit E2 [Deltaproteobacteria bacterium]|nr:2-oxo acid dehydrogenase subunit E2 [Deltaproteobacteria bacterium]